MINPKQLRLGNYVKQGVVTSIKEETARLKYQLDGEDKYSFVDYCDIEPIPLTEDWLIKLGFEKTYDSMFRTKYDHSELYQFGFDFSKTNKLDMEGFRLYGQYIKAQYVHQLQNLFYCLSGKELQLSQNTKS